MAFEVNMKPEQLWPCFHNRIDRFMEEMVEIACNEETNTVIFLTEENMYPYIYVYRNDKRVYQEIITNEEDAEKTLLKIYMKWLYPIMVVVDAEDGEDADGEEPDDTPPFEWDASDPEHYEMFMEEASERERVIRNAFEDLLAVLTEDAMVAAEMFGDDSDQSDHIIDHIVQYLAIDCGVRIRRPMVIFDEDEGEEVLSEYPYNDYKFSEEELNGGKS